MKAGWSLWELGTVQGEIHKMSLKNNNNSVPTIQSLQHHGLPFLCQSIWKIPANRKASCCCLLHNLIVRTFLSQRHSSKEETSLDLIFHSYLISFDGMHILFPSQERYRPILSVAVCWFHKNHPQKQILKAMPYTYILYVSRSFLIALKLNSLINWTSPRVWVNRTSLGGR